VKELLLTGLFGQAHERSLEWHHDPALMVYAPHWPPCPDDRLVTRTWRLEETAIGPDGPQPDLATLSMIVDEFADVQFEAEYLRAEEFAESLGLPEQGEDPATQALSERIAAEYAELERLRVEGAYEQLQREVEAKDPRRRNIRVPDPIGRAYSVSRAAAPLQRQRVPEPGDELLPRHPARRTKPGMQWICPRCGCRTRLNICRECDYPEQPHGHRPAHAH
jgi:hypothetical protein